MSQLNIAALGNADASKTVPVETVVAGSAKAWVYFNGSGTVAINDSFNVASITDNGTGDYTVNFATAMASVDYVITTSFGTTAGMSNVQALLTTSYGIETYNSAAALTDRGIVMSTVFSN